MIIYAVFMFVSLTEKIKNSLIVWQLVPELRKDYLLVLLKNAQYFREVFNI